MSISISKRRPNSVIPSVNMFNNWLNNHEKKVSTMIKTRASRTISTSLYRSTIVNDPQMNNNNNDNKFYYTGLTTKRPQHNRTYSSYRNTQSRLGVTKDQLIQMAEQISYLVQRAKKTRLDIKMIQKQYLIDIQRKQQQLKQQIFSLKKLFTYSINQQQQRRSKIKTQVANIKNNYVQIKCKLFDIDEKITMIENQCGFATLKNKLYK